MAPVARPKKTTPARIEFQDLEQKGSVQYPALSPERRAEFLESLDAEALAFLESDWATWGRPEQQWSSRVSSAMYTLWCCGRGWGKTRTGAEAARWVGEHPLEYFGHRDVSKWRGVLVGRTAADVFGTMLYGPSGLMSITPKADRPKHLASHRLLIFPSGVRMMTFSADEPDQLEADRHHGIGADADTRSQIA